MAFFFEVCPILADDTPKWAWIPRSQPSIDPTMKPGNYAPRESSGHEKLRCSFLLSNARHSSMVIKYSSPDCVPTCLPHPWGDCLLATAYLHQRGQAVCPQHLAVSASGYEKTLKVQDCLCCLQHSSMCNELPGRLHSLMEKSMLTLLN